MRVPLLTAALCVFSLVASASGDSRTPRGTVRIEAGSFRPLYPKPGEKLAQLNAFAIDTLPVTTAEFARFTARNPAWSKARVAAQYADAGYTDHSMTGATLLDQAATRVSWFAASAYCSERGARLPTTNEWEYVARASETRRDASADPEFRKRALQLRTQGRSGFRNVWGVRNLHTRILEWTSDFHPMHAGHEMSPNCSAGTVTTGDAGDYAAFLRYAFRSSTNPRRTQDNVGFRCAVSL